MMNLRSRFPLDTFLFKSAIALLASVNYNILEFDLNNNPPLTVLSAVFFQLKPESLDKSRFYLSPYPAKSLASLRGL
jgi:hypothetical protein